MNAQFTVSFEKISDESLASYLIGFQKNDVKDIAIQFLKLQYKKIDKIKFCDNKKSTVAEFVNPLTWKHGSISKNLRYGLILKEKDQKSKSKGLDFFICAAGHIFGEICQPNRLQ